MAEEKYENAHKKYESKAKEYFEHQEKRDSLFSKALSKGKANEGKLGDFFEKLELLIEIVQAWFKKEYTDIPKTTILSIIAAIIYFVSPIDLIPDFIVGLGLVDDVAVLGFAIKSISGELEKFKVWKLTRTAMSDSNQEVAAENDDENDEDESSSTVLV